MEIHPPPASEVRLVRLLNKPIDLASRGAPNKENHEVFFIFPLWSDCILKLRRGVLNFIVAN
jgi:hypothetical protein